MQCYDESDPSLLAETVDVQMANWAFLYLMNAGPEGCAVALGP